MRLSFEFANILGAVYHRGTIKFAPDGSSLFSPVGNKVVVYDLKGAKSSTLPLQVNYNISKLCIHPRNTLMIAASEKSHLYMVSLTTGKLLHFKEYKSFSEISHISFSPDGRFYCICGDSMVLVYVTPGSVISGKGREIMPFRLLRKFRVQHEQIVDVSWSSASNYLCVASQDTSLYVVNLMDREKSFVHLRGHSGAIISCYFANKADGDKQLYSLTKTCQLSVWDEITHGDDEDESGEKSSSEITGEASTKKMRAELRYRRSAKHYLKLAIEPDENKQEKSRRSNAQLTASDYNPNVKLLVVGYNTGHYSLIEMPSATLIYDFDSEFGSIDSLSINLSGDWIVFGSSVDPEVDINKATNKTQSRLMVWEWQSKSHILDQVGSGATISNLHECVSYSLDGTHIVCGNLAGQIKVWSALTGETVALFDEEHKGPIKSIKFAPNKSGKVIISASLDGSLKAFDLNKFKCFRTFKSPIEEKKPEFVCLDVDSTGEFIAAGTYNYFEVYLYSLQTGKFLEYLTGHEGPVTGVAFSPITNLLVSVSWDCTIRTWNLFEGSKCARDTITLAHEAITVAFRPDGNQIAVSLSNGQIVLLNPSTGDQLGAPIEGSDDLGTTQLVIEKSRDSKKYFLSLHYSVDGTYLIAAGNSNFICIYHASQKILVKKISVTFNMSMDGVFDYVSSRKRREFGFNLELLDRRQEERTFKPIQLPGSRKGDLGERSAKPVMSVCQIAFSPTMRSFSAATSEGVLIYSLDISRHFDPYKLIVGVDPSSIKRALKTGNYNLALVQSIQLNDKHRFQEVIEKIPLAEMESVISCLELDYIKRSLSFISQLITNTKHLEYYMLWIKRILYKHGVALKNSSSNDIVPIIRNIHQNTYRLAKDIKKNCDYCKYSLEYFASSLNNGSEDDEDKSEDLDDDKNLPETQAIQMEVEE